MGQAGEVPSMLQRKRSSICFLYAVPEADYYASRSIEPFDENKWNKNCNDSWRKELSAIDYGLLCN